MRERIPMPHVKTPEPDTSDIEAWLDDEPLEVRGLFTQLPHQLWKRHYEAIEKLRNPEEKQMYLSRIVEARKAGVEEFKSSDPHFQEIGSGRELGEKLNTLLESSEDILGAGQTARVKRLTLAEGQSVAVKYLLTPTAKTRSAEGEHDMLWEVDTVTHIEEEEKKVDAGDRVRVPHPRFYYKNDKLQCYGMEEIKGRNIEQLVNTEMPNTLVEVEQHEAVWKALKQKYSEPAEQALLYAELDRFAGAMHKVCLHGDIKLANMMADEEGTIFLIDFGQSIDVNTMDDKNREQFENLESIEREQLKYCIRSLLAGIQQGKLAA